MSVVVLEYAEQVARSKIIRASETACLLWPKPVLMRSVRVNHNSKVVDLKRKAVE